MRTVVGTLVLVTCAVGAWALIVVVLFNSAACSVDMPC